jgi:hypothetical protein
VGIGEAGQNVNRWLLYGVGMEEAGQNINRWLLYGLGIEEAGQNINHWLLSRSAVKRSTAESLALSIKLNKAFYSKAISL